MSTQAYDDRTYAGDRSGWLTFAAVVMFAVGFYRIIEAVAYFANSHKLNDLTNGLFSNHLWAWGIWDLLIAAAAIFAGLSLMSGGRFGRWIGYIWGVLVIVQAFTIVNLAPWYALLTIALAGFVIYGIASNPSEEIRP